MDYSTSDIAVSSFLLAKGYVLKEVDRSESRIKFKFENSKELKDDIKEFWAYKGLVSPLTYYQKLRELKMVIHSQE